MCIWIIYVEYNTFYDPVYNDLQKAKIRSLNVTGLSSLFIDLSNSFMKQNVVPMNLYFFYYFLKFLYLKS